MSSTRQRFKQMLEDLEFFGNECFIEDEGFRRRVELVRTSFPSYIDEAKLSDKHRTSGKGGSPKTMFKPLKNSKSSAH